MIPPVSDWTGDGDALRETERWDVLDSASFRPDGTHLSEASAYELVDRWLAPLVLTLALD